MKGSVRCVCSLCAGVAMSTPACSESDNKAFVDLGQARYEQPIPVNRAAFVPLGSIGTADGELAFSNVPAMAAGSDGKLAILDRFNCQVVLLDSTFQLIGRFGRCGSGPSELTLPWRVAFHGDSLVLFDGQQASFLLWDLHGRESRRFGLTHLRGARNVAAIAVVDDSTLVVGKELDAVVYTDQRYLVSVVDLHSGRFRIDAVHDVPVSLASRRPQTRPLYLCSNGNGTRNAANTVIINVWQPEAVVFSMFPEEIAAHVITPVEWLPLHYDENGPDAPGIPRAQRSVACGRDTFAHMYRVFDYTKRPRALREGMLEVRTYAGDLMYRELWSESGDSIFFGTPLAAFGNVYYFVDNYSRDYPVVNVYRFEPVQSHVQ